MERTGSKLTESSDIEIIKRALDQADPAYSQAAFFTLYSRYNKGVRAHISKYVKSLEEVEDICMETFAKAFKQLSTYNQENKFSTWLFRIARNTAFDHLSHDKTLKSARLTIDYAALELIDIPSGDNSPEEDVIGNQDHERFISCIDTLPSLYKEVAQYCFVDNMEYRDISETTGLPINTVKTRIKRAKGIIIKRLSEEEEEGL